MSGYHLFALSLLVSILAYLTSKLSAFPYAKSRNYIRFEICSELLFRFSRAGQNCQASSSFAKEGVVSCQRNRDSSLANTNLSSRLSGFWMTGPASEFSSDGIPINSRNKSGEGTPAIDSPTTHVQSLSFVMSDLQCCLKLSECLYSRAYKSKYLIRNYCKTYSAVTGPVCVEIYGQEISLGDLLMKLWPQ